jgi:cytochrome c oxidase subunit 3
MSQTRKAALIDDWNGYLTGLLVTSALGIAFTVFQVIGWNELINSGIVLSNNIAGAYLYVMSGLHIAHLLVGVALLIWFAFNAYDTRNDVVKRLLFESDPFSKMKVNLLCTYWHFVDGLWVYMYLFFLLNIYVLGR